MYVENDLMGYCNYSTFSEIPMICFVRHLMILFCDTVNDLFDETFDYLFCETFDDFVLIHLMILCCDTVDCVFSLQVLLFRYAKQGKSYVVWLYAGPGGSGTRQQGQSVVEESSGNTLRPETFSWVTLTYCALCPSPFQK